MIGYKATDKDGNCRGFHFEVGKTYTKDTPKEKLECCTNKVFHFCRELFAIEKESNYKLSENRLFEVIAGDYVRKGDKYGTNSLTILREITGEEKQELINSGYYNSGYRNSGDCNSGDWNSGYFNTDEPLVRIFNKETELKRDEINFPTWLHFDLTVWVSYDTATEKEKEEHKTKIETSGGFLKTLEYKEAFKIAYDKADDEGKIQLFKLPNFDADIFEQISGIDVRGDYERLMKE